MDILSSHFLTLEEMEDVILYKVEQPFLFKIKMDIKKIYNNIVSKLKKPEKHIPHGPYCYDEKGPCPFHTTNKVYHNQEDGYCYYLKTGDWESECTSLLWDFCKECDVNDYEEEYD